MRSVRAVASVWPSPGAQASLPAATLHRRQGAASRVQTWVLVASAFVLGLALGAAILVGAWRTTADRSDRSDAARAVAVRHLHDVRARTAGLSAKLHHVKVQLAATSKAKRRFELQLRNAIRQAAAAREEAAGERMTLLTVRRRASTVTSYVASLDAYVKATPSQDLDSGFLQSQLTYLSQAARRLQTP